jgi:hypothetical protein
MRWVEGQNLNSDKREDKYQGIIKQARRESEGDIESQHYI